MNNYETKNNKNQNAKQAAVETIEGKAKTIKLGIDVHLDRYVVVWTNLGDPITATDVTTSYNDTTAARQASSFYVVYVTN